MNLFLTSAISVILIRVCCITVCGNVMRFEDYSKVLKHISQFTSSQTPLCPQLCMFLEFIPLALLRPLEKEKWLISVKPDTIAPGWKSTGCPSLGQWLIKLTSGLALYKLTQILRKKTYEFSELISFIEEV